MDFIVIFEFSLVAEILYYSINILKRTKKDQWLKFGKLCTTPGQWGLLSGQVQIKDDPHLVNQLEFYVEGPKKSRNYLVDGASLKVSKVPESFYEKSKSEIDRLRKVDLTVEAGYPEYSNVTISISQVKHDFPFGSGRFSILDLRLGFFTQTDFWKTRPLDK